MFVLIHEKNHKDFNRIGWVTMSEYGFLTVTLRQCSTRTFVHISNVTVLGEDSSSDDSTDDYDSERSYVDEYSFENENHVDENGKPFGYHEYYDSDDNTIKNYESESSESESSQSDTSKKN